MTEQTQTPAAALLTLRILWGALIAGQIGFAVVLVVLWSTGTAALDDRLARRMLPFIVAGAGVLVPLAIFVRMQVYKAHWREDLIDPQGYFLGNLAFLAMLEGGSMASLVNALLGGTFVPYALPALFLLAVQVLAFPTGGPMHPTSPRV